MQRLGTRFVRVMSFKPDDEEATLPAEVVRRVREVTALFLDAGLQPVHENCMNHGGMSWRHALELLDAVPGLQWVFDTANPVGDRVMKLQNNRRLVARQTLDDGRLPERPCPVKPLHGNGASHCEKVCHRA